MKMRRCGNALIYNGMRFFEAAVRIASHCNSTRIALQFLLNCRAVLVVWRWISSCIAMENNKKQTADEAAGHARLRLTALYSLVISSKTRFSFVIIFYRLVVYLHPFVIDYPLNSITIAFYKKLRRTYFGQFPVTGMYVHCFNDAMRSKESIQKL